MWQTRYALAVPKNLGLGLNFRPCSKGYFFSGCPQSVPFNKLPCKKLKKAHGRQCPVKLCSTYNARKGFYHIPEHPGRRLDWLHACKLPSTTPYSTTICWKHFKLQDFKNEITEENIRQCKFGQLKKNVVPSLNLPMDDQKVHSPY